MSTRPVPLTHTTSRGKLRDWTTQKLKSTATAAAYAADPKQTKRSLRMADCANRLDFERDDTGAMTLVRAWRCRNRHCAVCIGHNSRRDLAILIARVREHAVRHPAGVPIFLTLTIPNTDAAGLKGGIDMLLGGFRKLVRMPVVQRAVMGWHRSLEITTSENTGYHPHLHVLAFIRDGQAYFAPNSSLYLTQPRWAQLWSRATGITRPIVDVRRIGTVRDGVVDLGADDLYELVKYAIKPAGFYAWEDNGWVVDPTTLLTIHHAVHGRRLRDVGGSLRAIRTRDLPNPKADARTEAALNALEIYEFAEWLDPDTGEILGPGYWQRAPPAPAT